MKEHACAYCHGPHGNGDHPGYKPTGGRPEWGRVGFLPESKYLVEYSETMGGWNILSREYEQGMSAKETT